MLDLCPRCDGEGTVEVPGYSLNPYSGIRVIDPQEERTETCPTCRGDGEVPRA